MGLRRGMFGERSVTKVAGLYPDQASAEQAARQLSDSAGLAGAQLRVLGPADAGRSQRDLLGTAVEPEDRGIFRTMLKAHAVTGMAGALVGLLLWLGLRAMQIPMVVASPWFALMVTVGFATAFGLMVGGLVTLRPDHAALIDELQQALRAGRWALVAHPTRADQLESARAVLRDSGAQVLATL